MGIFGDRSELPVYTTLMTPALRLATDEVNRRFPHLRFSLVTRDTGECQKNHAGAVAAEEYFLRKVSVFVGPACGLSLDSVGRMASYWNVPVCTAGGVGVEFGRKNVYSTLTRMAFSLGKYYLFDHLILADGSLTPSNHALSSLRSRSRKSLCPQNSSRARLASRFDFGGRE